MEEGVWGSILAEFDVGFWGSWASLISLAAGIYSVLWIRKTRAMLKRDREKRSRNLPEAHYNLLCIKRYLTEVAKPRPNTATMEKLYRVEFFIESLLEGVYRQNIKGSNAFAVVGNYYASLGLVPNAIFYYERALSSLGKDDVFSGRDFVCCIRKLQECHLAAWHPKKAVALCLEFQKTEGLLEVSKDGPVWICFRCASYTLLFAFLEAKAAVTGKRQLTADTFE